MAKMKYRVGQKLLKKPGMLGATYQEVEIIDHATMLGNDGEEEHIYKLNTCGVVWYPSKSLDERFSIFYGD